MARDGACAKKMRSRLGHRRRAAGGLVGALQLVASSATGSAPGVANASVSPQCCPERPRGGSAGKGRGWDCVIGEMLGAADGDGVTIGRLRAPPSYCDALSSDAARPALSAAAPGV